MSADLIDACEDMKAINGQLADGEVLRLLAVAQTYYEDAAMWAVKAATKVPRD